MGIKDELESGRELKCVSLHMYFFFLFCYLKKRSQMQSDNCSVIIGSKYLFQNMYLLSIAVILHHRGSLHFSWSHSI